MPKLTNRPPSYRHHKPSGQAVVTVGGRDHYLGPYGSPASHVKYQEVLQRWAGQELPAKEPVAPASTSDPYSDLRIGELLVDYLEFADRYYRKNGEPTGEILNFKDAIRPLRQLYERSRVADFGPVALKAVRELMIGNGLSRKVVNARINRIRRVFKWGVENQRVSPAVLQGLQAVAPLKKGRTEARETQPVTTVPEPYIEMVKKHVSKQVAAMIDLQRLTGMRPGEVVLMRGRDLDMSGKLWVYTPQSHKTEHHGIQRTIYIGPKAQEVIKPFLKRELADFLFRPIDSLAAFRKRRAQARKTKRYSAKPPRKAHPRKRAGEHYTSGSYCYAVHQACKQAGIPCWGPNRLRHNAATFLRKQYGIEAARVVLGHSSAAITEVYAEMDRSQAARIMEEIG